MKECTEQINYKNNKSYFKRVVFIFLPYSPELNKFKNIFGWLKNKNPFKIQIVKKKALS